MRTIQKYTAGRVTCIFLKYPQACVESDFKELYDQAGLMIYLDEKHWIKTGIEYNDEQPMIGSVVTNEVSDWATGM